MNKRIEKLIANYFDSKISEKETIELINWIEKGNIDVFNEYVTLNFSIEQIKIAKENSEALSWDRIASRINSKSSDKIIPFYKRGMFKYAIAAGIILLISLTVVFTKDNRNITESKIVNNKINTGTNKAILTLEDGTKVTLEKGEKYATNNLVSNGEELIYDSKDTAKADKVYNYLTIPRGGQYFVKLSDETKVWLNSESKLKYPVNFIEGETRVIELVYGEAYFDVSPSTEHKGSKFKVLTNTQEIEVLGTEFNVKAYADESNVYTTLVEGEVSIEKDGSQFYLKPRQQAITNLNKEGVMIKAADVVSVISWRKGLFMFKIESLKNIMKTLSRWYDVDIVFANKELENIEFKGVFRKNQTLEEILMLIQNTNFINQFKIEGKTVLIN